MTKVFGFIALFFLVLTGMSCGSGGDNGLTVSMVPDSPILIPYGDGTTVGGFFILAAPYFTISSLNVDWAGPGNLNIIGVIMTTPTTSSTTTPTGGPTYSVNCGFGGDDILNMFPHNLNSNNEVIIKPGTPVASNPFGCGGITVPTNPIPTSFNIPVQVQVIGVVLDNNNNTTGRVEATTTITVQ